MRAWIASRLAQTVLVVFLSLTAVFGMVRLSGDPVLLFMPMDIQAKDVSEYRQRLGFNDPHLVMPSLVLAAFDAARVARLTRSALLEALGEDYVLTARAKGLAERRVIGKHALRNSAIPIVTLAGLEAGQLLGGAVVTETIFAWPGLGRLTVQALLNRDFPVVMAAVSFTSIVYTLMNLVVDLLYGWLDPRVRLRS